VGRRSPRVIALEFLDEIDRKGGRALRHDLYKIAGSEAFLNRWLEGFFKHHNFLKEVKEGRKTFYIKTEEGQLFHNTLKDGRFFTAYRQISRRRFRPHWAVE
jgi:wobble nucleotide-excising tRNase